MTRMQPHLDELTWLGQAGFRLCHNGSVVVIDPFFSEHEKRLRPPPDLSFVGDADWVLATHEHIDHLDIGCLRQIASRNPKVNVALPAPIAHMVEGIVPANQIHAVEVGTSIRAGSVVVEVVPAVHGIQIEDAYTDGSAGDGRVRFVGYVVRTAARSYYHSGDCIVTAELIDCLAGKQVDVALLPVNGRDYFREQSGIVGNMDVREAIGFAKAIRASVLVPMHWDLFRGNTERPGAVADQAVGQLHVLVMNQLSPLIW